MAQILKEFNTDYGMIIFKSMEEEQAFKKYGYYLMGNEMKTNIVYMKRDYLNLLLKNYPTYTEKLAATYAKTKNDILPYIRFEQIVRNLVLIFLWVSIMLDAMITNYLIPSNFSFLLTLLVLLGMVVIVYLFSFIINAKYIVKKNIILLNSNSKSIMEVYAQNNKEETRRRLEETIIIIQKDDLMVNKEQQINALRNTLNKLS